MRGRILAWSFFVKKFTETFVHDLPVVENGVLRGAKLLGLNSKNSRRYQETALAEAAKQYDGKKVYVDHPKDTSAERRMGDFAGVLENVQYRKGDGLYGDIVLRQESTHFKGIVELASHPKFRKSCGFSHVAEGESTFDGDTEIIESIKRVYSVDLVTDPATTGGIFESIQVATEDSKFREDIKQLPDGELRKRLTEMVDGGFMGGLSLGGAEKDAPTDALSQMVSLLRDAVAALSDSLKSVAKANKPAAPVVAPTSDKPAEEGGKPVPGEENEEDDDMSPEDKEKIAAFEGVQRELSEQRAKNLLLESGREATTIRTKALANCANEDEQRALLESWPLIEEERRPARSPGLIESENDFPRDNPEKFAALLR
jgi:hypothetical protein